MKILQYTRKADTIAIDNDYRYVLCPYCNEIHKHGLSEGIRYSHCKDNQELYNVKSNKYTLHINKYIKDEILLSLYKERLWLYG